MKRAESKLTAVRSARRVAPPPLRALRPATSFMSVSDPGCGPYAANRPVAAPRFRRLPTKNDTTRPR